MEDSFRLPSPVLMRRKGRHPHVYIAVLANKRGFITYNIIIQLKKQKQQKTKNDKTKNKDESSIGAVEKKSHFFKLNDFISYE